MNSSIKLFTLVLLAILGCIKAQDGCTEISFCDSCALQLDETETFNFTICETCKNGFKANEDKTLCVEQCPEVQPLGTCICPPTFVNDGGFCSPCDVDNCILCAFDSIDKCDFCETGYTLNDDGICQPNCPPTQLSSCVCSPKNVLKNGQCLTCSVQNCLLCQYNDNNICDICRDGFINSNSGAQCATCEAKFCKLCSDTNKNQCRECLKGYILNEVTNICQIEGCTIQGQIFNGFQCACPEQTYLDGSKCELCPDNCDQCGDNGCSQCLIGYYLNLNQQCSQCMVNCVQCRTNTACLTCSPGFQLNDNNICEAIPQDIGGTLEATIINQDGTQQVVVIACAQTCLQCTSSTICNKCKGNYANVNFECLPCNDNCKKCSQDDPSLCTSCYNGLILDNFGCYPCPQNCLQCANKDFCSKCVPGYFSNQGVCQVCPDNCIKCTNQGCVQCKSGFANIRPYCVQCLLGCSVCSSVIISNCISCASGYYLNQTAVQVEGQTRIVRLCTLCPSTCAECSLNDGQIQCSACQTGFRLYEDKMCYQVCSFPCVNCVKGQPTSCQSCYAGYVLNGNQCLANTGCNSTKTCVACPKDFALIKKQCFQCDYQIDHCTSCPSSDLQSCSSCQRGFYLTTNQCTLCPTGCKACLSASFCSSCVDGYYAVVDGKDPTGKCQLCDSTFNCKTCVQVASKCTSCDEQQYQLIGQKCLSLNYTGLVLELAAQLSQFSSDLTAVKLDLLKILYPPEQFPGFTINMITITGMESGSVRLSSRIDQPQGVQGTDVQQRAAQSLQQGGEIGPVKIQSSPKIQIIVVEPEPQPQPQPQPVQPTPEDSQNTTDNEEQQNLGLILGLSIPLGIIGLVILFFAMKSSATNSEKLNIESTNGLTGLEEI